jgi:hypothetical protein
MHLSKLILADESPMLLGKLPQDWIYYGEIVGKSLQQFVRVRWRSLETLVLHAQLPI